MKTKEEIKKWLLKNCIDYFGNLDLSGLDFSDFDGNVIIGQMKVKWSLDQSHQEVGLSLVQNYQGVGNNLFQDCQEVGKDLFQDGQKVKDSFFDHKLADDEEWKAHDNFVVRGKKLEEISRKELEEMGYKLKE